MSIRVSRILVFVVAYMSLASVSCTAAQGYVVGRYQVEACTQAVGYQNNLFTESTNDLRLEVHTSCGESPAPYQSTTIANLEIADVLDLPEEIPVGAEGAWQVIAPAGETIAEVSGNETLYRNGGNGWQVYRESESPNGTTTIEQSCNQPFTESCGLGGPFQATALHARSMVIGAKCEAEEYEPSKFYKSCPDGALRHDVRAGINEATVTIEDLTPPSNVAVTNLPSGSQHGAITIDGSATDETAGLLALGAINSLGETIASINLSGDCDYSKLTPCPTSIADLQIPIDTEKLTEGTNQLRLVATSAAHVEEFSAPFEIDVDNRPPAPPIKQQEKTTNEETGNAPDPPPSPQSNGPVSNNNSKSESTTKQKSSLPSLPIHLAEVKFGRNWLTVKGNTSTNAHGVLSCQVRLAQNGHTLMIRREAPIVRGRFSLRVPLRYEIQAQHANITIHYGGGRSYRATAFQRHVALLHP